MRIFCFLLTLLLPICLFAQKPNSVLNLQDSLRLDSLAKNLIRTGKLDMEHLSDFETDKVIEMRDLMGIRMGKIKAASYAGALNKLNLERSAIRDSLIASIQSNTDADVQLSMANLLLNIGDSTSLRFLVSNLSLAFHPGAWHSDLWGQYPIARMVCNAALDNQIFYPYARDFILKYPLEDPVNYFYAELFSNMFRGADEVMYIYLNLLLQKHPDNKVLKDNIQSIKSTLKNY